MIKCPFCGVAYVDNTIFCVECGQYLLEDENKATDPLDTPETGKITKKLDSAEPTPLLPSREPRAVRLKIGERKRELEIPLHRAISLGRVDPGSDVFPDIDLTEHGPAKNISRRHASIRKQEGVVIVEDIGSVNGTFLNGKRLAPYLPEKLQHGDTLYLGKLRVEIEIVVD